MSRSSQGEGVSGQPGSGAGTEQGRPSGSRGSTSRRNRPRRLRVVHRRRLRHRLRRRPPAPASGTGLRHRHSSVGGLAAARPKPTSLYQAKWSVLEVEQLEREVERPVDLALSRATASSAVAGHDAVKQAWWCSAPMPAGPPRSSSVSYRYLNKCVDIMSVGDNTHSDFQPTSRERWKSRGASGCRTPSSPGESQTSP